MVIAVIKGERQQLVFLSDLGSGGGGDTVEVYSNIEIEVLEDVILDSPRRPS